MDSWLKHHAGKARVLGLVSAKANYFIFVPRTRTALLTPELSYNVPKTVPLVTRWDWQGSKWMKMKLPSLTGKRNPQ